jgi:hypothetical protein
MNQASDKPVEKFRSPEIRAKLALIFIYLEIALSAIVVFLDIYFLYLLNKINNGETISDTYFSSLENFEMYLALIVIAVSLTSLILFLVWFYRVYKNLTAFKAKRDRSPAWAIWSYFIPFVNFVIPYLTMKETWLTSLKSKEKGEVKHSFVQGWWALYLISAIYAQIAGRIWLAADSLEIYTIAYQHDIGSSIFLAGSGVVTIFLIKKITQAQVEKKQRGN